MTTSYISIKTLREMNSCQEGQETFVNTFGSKEVPLLEAFKALPKKDVIWFIIHGLYSGHCPPIVRQLLPVPYHPNRKNPSIFYLEKNYKKFIDDFSML